MTRKAFFEGDPQQAAVVLDHLCGLLACLRALQLSYHTSHWQVRGASFYGDHLLFQRLYDGDDESDPLGDQIDTLAEKVVGYFGSEAVSLSDQMQRMASYTDRWSLIGCPHERGLQAERDVQDLLSRAYESIKEADAMTLGLDDFLMATANQHEVNTYLIQQVKDDRPNKTAKARLPSGLEVRVKDHRGDDAGVWTTQDFKDNHSPDHEVTRAVSGLKRGQTWKSSDGWTFTRIASGAPTAEGDFYKDPRKSEVREFGETGALSNIPKVVENAEITDDLPVEVAKAEIEGAREAPPTPVEIAKKPGGDAVSTLNRFVVDTSDPAAKPAVQMNKARMANWLKEL